MAAVSVGYIVVWLTLCFTVIKAPEMIRTRRVFQSVFLSFQVGLTGAADYGSTGAFASSSPFLLGARQSVPTVEDCVFYICNLAAVTLKPRMEQIPRHFPSTQHTTMRVLSFKPAIPLTY
jgi:hypothetical protein